MNIKFSPPDVGEEEIEEVIEAIKSGWITTGPKTKLFEQKITELCNTEKTVCLNSSTAAMEMTLRLLGIGPGDEVITSAYTYTASCSVICHVGATPVLVDIQKDNFASILQLITLFFITFERSSAKILHTALLALCRARGTYCSAVQYKAVTKVVAFLGRQ